MSFSGPNVVIIQEQLPHYRSAFFSLLREKLGSAGVTLDLVYGAKCDSNLIPSSLEWATPVSVLHIGPFLWHHLGKSCSKADLIVAPQEVKHLRCHALQLKCRISGPRFAYWGHGKNFQTVNQNSPAERLKRFLSRRVDWWFAYNDLSARIVRDFGFPTDRITSVGNAIDTHGLIELNQSLTEADLAVVRAELNLHSKNVAVYTGGLYSHKRIGFLLESSIRIRELIPDFELIVIGSGPDRHLVSSAATEHPWIHDIGPKNDMEKVPYWALSKVLLMPGLTGLVVVDSFALGTPLVTTDYPYHSPEIDYLKSGDNGLLISCGDSHESYAKAVADLLNDPPRLERLRRGALASASLHTIENMVDNFAEGIRQALGSPRYRRSFL